MKKRMMMFICLWLLILAIEVVFKVLFVLAEPVFGSDYIAQLPSIVFHGFSMDLTMSAYLMAPVLIWTVVSLWVTSGVMPKILRGYVWVAAALMALAYGIDAVLYPYWGFRLDTTPLFYFTTSPQAAMASLAWYWEVLLVIVAALVAWGLESLLWLVARRFMPLACIKRLKSKIWSTVAWLAIGGLMIIPIRGGLTVSTMSPARAYFSNDIKLNHAAVNPMFSFIYSVLHVDTLGKQMRYFDDAEAERICADAEVIPVSSADSTAMAAVRLNTPRPDVYLIIIESFSNNLMPSLGGEDIAVKLDSIAAEGVLFTNFYAESFRTDRALPTILSGYPALPTTSVMRYPEKFRKLPALANSLKKNGYDTWYYYGGDINFTNMRAYLVSTGFDNLVKDSDFPVSERMSKWGVHDEVLFNKVMADNRPSPTFTVIQTSSSHEPFEVPYQSLHENPRINSCAYADSCVADFIHRLHTTGKWDNALVIMVPDHWGTYPKGITDYSARHKVPLILTGGALDGGPQRISVTASQSAIAPTVLGLLGMDYSDFYNPVSLLNPNVTHRAWITEPDWMGIVEGNDAMTVLNIQRDTAEPCADKAAPDHIRARAQLLYRDLDKR